MGSRLGIAAGFAWGLLGLTACSSQPTSGPEPTRSETQALAAKATEPAVLPGVSVSLAHAESSRPLRELHGAAAAGQAWHPHAARKKPLASASPSIPFDPVRQPDAPRLAMPPSIVDFLGQGATQPVEMCTFPNPPPSCTTTGLPPDTNGAAGPNHYVQTVNGGIGIWSKSGTIVKAPELLNLLWAGYTGTNPGNACATQNDGDPVVLYDQLADRWFISQFSLPNGGNTAPSFQCVAVSKTGDPTGAYWLYDFKYNEALNDYPKFGVWPDAYYATFNMFSATGYDGDDLCAMDRVSMLAGMPATQQCFLQMSQNVFGALPASVDGPIPPHRGEPGFFVELGEDAMGNFNNTLGLWTLHVDWTTPANSMLTGPTFIPVAAYTPTCGAGAPCIREPSPGLRLDPLSDRLMFRLNYRNFGTYESLLVNHSVTAGTTSGVRWYEVRSPAATPTLFQQGTYAPADANWRWCGSIAQDQAADMTLGFSVTSTTLNPAVAWTGRLASDAPGTMGQGETILDTGTGVETGTPPSRWGDYSDLTVDPSDDCTFWYTQELYNTSGDVTWDTRIASVKFPSCAANDFSIAIAPPSQSVVQGGQVTYTVSTASTLGTAEMIALNVQDLPTGVTGTFNPTSVTAGASSTLTVAAAAAAPPAANVVFTVIGTAPSAVHAATAQVSVTGCLTTCPAPDNCGTIPDGCGGMITCGPGCTMPQTCGGGGTPNVCGCTPITTCPAGDNCGTVPNGCGGTVMCGTCPSGEMCMGNTCVASADGGADSGARDSGVTDSGSAGDSGPVSDSGVADSGRAADSGLVRDSGPALDTGAPSDAASGEGGAGGGSGDTGGCGCRIAGSAHGGGLPAFGLLALVGAVGARRRRRPAGTLSPRHPRV